MRDRQSEGLSLPWLIAYLAAVLIVGAALGSVLRVHVGNATGEAGRLLGMLLVGETVIYLLVLVLPGERVVPPGRAVLGVLIGLLLRFFLAFVTATTVRIGAPDLPHKHLLLEMYATRWVIALLDAGLVVVFLWIIRSVLEVNRLKPVVAARLKVTPTPPATEDETERRMKLLNALKDAGEELPPAPVSLSPEVEESVAKPPMQPTPPASVETTAPEPPTEKTPPEAEPIVEPVPEMEPPAQHEEHETTAAFVPISEDSVEPVSEEPAVESPEEREEAAEGLPAEEALEADETAPATPQLTFADDELTTEASAEAPVAEEAALVEEAPVESPEPQEAEASEEAEPLPDEEHELAPDEEPAATDTESASESEPEAPVLTEPEPEVEALPEPPPTPEQLLAEDIRETLAASVSPESGLSPLALVRDQAAALGLLTPENIDEPAARQAASHAVAQLVTLAATLQAGDPELVLAVGEEGILGLLTVPGAVGQGVFGLTMPGVLKPAVATVAIKQYHDIFSYMDLPPMPAGETNLLPLTPVAGAMPLQAERLIAADPRLLPLRSPLGLILVMAEDGQAEVAGTAAMRAWEACERLQGVLHLGALDTLIITADRGSLAIGRLAPGLLCVLTDPLPGQAAALSLHLRRLHDTLGLEAEA